MLPKRTINERGEKVTAAGNIFSKRKGGILAVLTVPDSFKEALAVKQFPFVSDILASSANIMSTHSARNRY